MKKLFTFLASLTLLMSIANTAHAQDVYTAGYDWVNDKGIATVWKNGEKLYQLTDGNYDANANAIVMIGSDIYVGGYEVNSSGVYIAKVWKNGEILYTLSTLHSRVYSMAVLNGDLYIAGSERNSSGYSVAKIWKNNVLYCNLTDGTKNAAAQAITVYDGDIYTAGYEINSISLRNVKVWKNNELLRTMNNGTNHGDAYCIAVSDGDVYVGGQEHNIGKGYNPILWKNGSNQFYSLDYEPNINYAIHSIVVSGEDVYTGGQRIVYKNGTQLYKLSASAIGPCYIALQGGNVITAMAKTIFKNKQEIYTLSGDARIKAMCLAPDTEAPIVANKTISVDKVTGRSIDISWAKATDNVTVQSDITYHIFCVEGLHTNEFNDEKLDLAEARDAMFKVTGSNTYTLTQYVDATEESFSHAEIQPETDYTFIVLAEDEEGNYTQYTAESVQTGIEDIEGPTVTDKTLTPVKVTSTSIEISWNKATDNVTAQEDLVYWVFCTNFERVSIKDIDSYIFTGLLPGTDHYITVEVTDESENESYYEEIKVTTLAVGEDTDTEPPVIADKTINVGTTTKNSIALSWDDAQDNVTVRADLKYEVRWKRTVDADWSSSGSFSRVYSYTITGLSADTEYDIRLDVSDAEGNTAAYDPTSARTDKGHVGINETKTAALIIYPNPVNELLHIKTDMKIESISIYNLSGMIIKTINDAGDLINVSDLISGVYFLKITTADGDKTVRMIKQ